jgi:tetratricopeptide (TPR) repeat protein/Cdc6-like AAA superfamily ATPase
MAGRWQTASVFISSTFRDMHSERDILIKKVFPELRARLLPYRIRLIDIDLRWGITREEAENEKTIDFCLNSINDCRPLFLGILGERYGWIPAPYPESIRQRFPELVKESQTSITALEIIHGVLSEEEKNAIFFFRDPLFEASVPEDFKPIVRAESPEHDQKQKKLKDLIRKEKLVSPVVENYPCSFKGLYVDWELLAEGAPEGVTAFMGTYGTKGLIGKEDIQQASAEVMDWLQENATLVLDKLEIFVEEVQEALWKMLCHAFPVLNERADFQEKPEELEDDEHQRVLDEHLAAFVGRETLREDYIKAGNGQLMALTGASGRGKTAMLAALVKDWKSHYPDGDAVFHFVGATSSGRLAEGLFSRLLRLVARSAGKEVPGGLSKDFLPNALRKLIEEFPADKQLLIAVDDFDYVFKSDGFDLRWLPGEIPANVSILLSALDDKAWSEKNLRQLGKAGAALIPLPALRETERKEIIRLIPSLWAKTLDSRQIDLLSDHPGTNNPLYLTIALEELRKFGSFERLEKRIQSFPQQGGEQGLILLYRQLLGRLERELDRELVKQALGLLACSLTGLSEEEISQLCPDVDPENLAQLWRELRVHLLFSQGSLSFYHETLRLTVQELYLDAEEDKHYFHQQLADFFEGCPNRERALAEELEHNHALGRKDTIRSLLCTPENYVIMRHSYPNWLNANWNRIGENNPIALLHASLCENLGAYEQVLDHKEGIPLNFWQISEKSTELKFYNEKNDKHIHPVLADWQHDWLIELSRSVEEDKIFGEAQFYLAVKCLAILEAELGAVHARTLEALSVALPMLATQMNPDSAREYHTRAFMMAMMYLPEHHPVCLRIRMLTQDYLREVNPEHSFRADFEELAAAFVNAESCDKLRELERDALIREDQRNVFFANLLIRHSQMLRQAGESEASYEFCQKAVKFCDRQLGPVHEFAVLARNNLAMNYVDQRNDFESGRKILEETLSYSDSRVGSSSYIGLSLLNNLSTTLGNAGKFEEALPVYRETLDRKTEVYGAGSASTLHSVYNLGFCHWNMGHFDEALKLCRQAIAGFEALGAEQKSVVYQLKLHEIEIIEESGDPARALQLFEPFYQNFMQEFDGADWLSYYLLNSKQATIFQEQGRMEEAAGIYEATLRIVLPVEAAVKQIDHVFQSLMEVLRQLLNTGENSENPQHRLELLKRITGACQQRYPEGDEELCHWQSEYGEALNQAEHFEEAEALLQICARNFAALKGIDDPDTRIANTRLSQSLLGLGKNEESEALLMSVFEASASRKTDTVSNLKRHLGQLEGKYGPDHPETIEAMQQSAALLLKEDHPQEALTLLIDACERSEKTFGILEKQTVSIAMDLARGYLRIEEYPRAEVILRRVADGYEKKEGLKDERTLEALTELGEVLIAMKEFSEAIAVFKKVLQGAQSVYGSVAIQSLDALIHLARLYQMNKDDDKFSATYAEFTSRIKNLGTEEHIEGISRHYQEMKEQEREERIEGSLAMLKGMQKKEKMKYLGDSDEDLRKHADEISARELDREKPEGSGELMRWLDLMLWLIPEKDTVELWEGFCSGFEALCDPADPAKYLPRFRYSTWLIRNEGSSLALDQLSAIWRDGDLETHYVQEAALMLLGTLAESYKPEEVIPVIQNMADSFMELLGEGHPRTHQFISETAGYLFENKEYEPAREKYSFLLEQLKEKLDEDHPFLQNILQKLEAIEEASN